MPLCDVADCPDRIAGKEFSSVGALDMHKRGRHGTAAGVCTECVPPKEFKRLDLHQAAAHKPDPGPPAPPAGDGGVSAPGDVSDTPPPPGAETFVEQVPGGIRPTPPPPPGPADKPRLMDRVRSKVWGEAPTSAPRGNGASATDEATPKGKASRPRPTARVSTTDLGSLAWGGIGAGLEKTGIDVPVGRAMKFQAPMAGAILDEWWARTWFDRIVLQRIAPRMDDTEKLGSLLALPILVALVERNPDGGGMWAPLLGQVIQANLVNMAPVVKKARQDAEKVRKAMAELEMDLPEGADPIQAVADMLFAPPRNAPPPPQEGPGWPGPPQGNDVTAPL